MSSLSDFINAVSADNANIISVAGATIGLGAQIGSILSGGISVVQFIQNIINPADAKVLAAIAQLTTDLEQAKNDIELQAAANFLSATKQTFDANINTAATDFARLYDFVTDPNLSEDFIQTIINDCFAANQFFADNDDLWQWSWLDAPKYNDVWSGTVAPPQTDSVFTYTPLPYLLRSTYILVTVVGALKPPELTSPDFLGRLNSTLARLENVHNTIQAAIVPTKIPQPSDIEYISFENVTERLGTNWFNTQGGGLPIPEGDPALWPFGAVEMFSGAHTVDSYWPFLPLEIDPAGGTSFTGSFLALLQLRIEDHKKTLYRQIGLPAVRQSMNDLRAMTGQPLLSDRPFDTWSFKEAFAILGVPLPGSWSKSMVPFLKGTPPYSGGVLFPPVAGNYPPSMLPNSFRSLFAPP